MRDLRSYGFDMWGCDNGLYRSGDYTPDERMLEIGTFPYRLPFEDSSFDAVISTSVMEHAKNKAEIFREIHRILKPDGATLHLFPGKFYLPVEPHIYVPFVSWMWPDVPRWWLALWSILGIRNEFRKDFDWRKNLAADIWFCKNNMSYWTYGRYRALVTGIFGNCAFPNDYYVRMANGSSARIARAFLFPSATGWVLGRVRMGLLLARKCVTSRGSDV